MKKIVRWPAVRKIDITEPSVEETIQIINGLKPRITKRTMMCALPQKRCVRQ
ncbi:hypothetical protein MJ585_09995 [Klebsiella pneumoniae]|nr:hypothetical protein MJ585_09995 [Klebsiella pneumoniae]